MMKRELATDDAASRLQWLARAGIRLTVDADSPDEWAESAPAVQAIFESIESIAADLYERLRQLERETRGAA